MSMMMSQWALTAMQEDLAEAHSDANPYVREGRAIFTRHDEVRVIQENPNLVTVEFRWRGVLAHTMQIGCNFAAGERLTLGGIEGRMEMWFSAD